MWWLAVALMAFGAPIAAIGWLLNMNTPIQQPLPIVGGAMVIIGAVVLLILY